MEASAAYLAAAREETARRGHTDRLKAHHGDFVALAPEIPSADIVTLDRVICCYRDMPALVAQSAARARKLYGVVYPRAFVVPAVTVAPGTSRCFTLGFKFVPGGTGSAQCPFDGAILTYYTDINHTQVGYRWSLIWAPC